MTDRTNNEIIKKAINTLIDKNIYDTIELINKINKTNKEIDDKFNSMSRTRKKILHPLLDKDKNETIAIGPWKNIVIKKGGVSIDGVDGDHKQAPLRVIINNKDKILKKYNGKNKEKAKLILFQMKELLDIHRRLTNNKLIDPNDYDSKTLYPYMKKTDSEITVAEKSKTQSIKSTYFYPTKKIFKELEKSNNNIDTVINDVSKLDIDGMLRFKKQTDEIEDMSEAMKDYHEKQLGLKDKLNEIEEKLVDEAHRHITTVNL